MIDVSTAQDRCVQLLDAANRRGARPAPMQSQHFVEAGEKLDWGKLEMSKAFRKRRDRPAAGVRRPEIRLDQHYFFLPAAFEERWRHAPCMCTAPEILMPGCAVMLAVGPPILDLKMVQNPGPANLAQWPRTEDAATL
jgi:hypothetical protein